MCGERSKLRGLARASFGYATRRVSNTRASYVTRHMSSNIWKIRPARITTIYAAVS